jgi:hypothetical protein
MDRRVKPGDDDKGEWGADFFAPPRAPGPRPLAIESRDMPLEMYASYVKYCV